MIWRRQTGKEQGERQTLLGGNVPAQDWPEPRLGQRDHFPFLSFSLFLSFIQILIAP